jgi:hypothetical protein
MRRLLFAAVFMSIAFIIAQPGGRSQTPVALSVEGPAAMTPQQVANYYVNVSGGPAENNGNYTIKYWVQGSNIGGASPLIGSPGERSGPNKTYEVNVTAPSNEVSFDLVVEVTSGNGTANATVRKILTVQVLAPITLTASFRNNGGAAVLNTTVRFYVDNIFAGSKVISRINPGDRGTATLSWIPAGLSAGQHTIRVEADIDGNGVIDPSKGEVVAYDTFYRMGGELATGYLILIAALIFVGGLFLIVAYRRRKRTR